MSWEQAGLSAPAVPSAWLGAAMEADAAGEDAVLDLGNRGWGCWSTKLPTVQFPGLHARLLTGLSELRFGTGAMG